MISCSQLIKKNASTAQARGWRAVCEPGQGLPRPAGHHSRREEAIPLSSRCVRSLTMVGHRFSIGLRTDRPVPSYGFSPFTH